MAGKKGKNEPELTVEQKKPINEDMMAKAELRERAEIGRLTFENPSVYAVVVKRLMLRDGVVVKYDISSEQSYIE